MIQTYFIFTEKQLAQIQRRAGDRLELWAEKWLPNNHGLRAVSAQNAHERTPGTQSESEIAHLGVKLISTCEDRQKIYEQLTNDRYHKATHDNAIGLINRVVETMLKDLAAAFAGQNPSPISPPSQYQGSGTVLVHIETSEWGLQLMLPQTVARQLIDPPPAPAKATLAPRKSCIGKGRVKVRVNAGEVEIKLAELAELAPGQVVRLNLKTNQAFKLTVADTEAKLCNAYLGQCEGKKAVQLIS